MSRWNGPDEAEDTPDDDVQGVLQAASFAGTVVTGARAGQRLSSMNEALSMATSRLQPGGSIGTARASRASFTSSDTATVLPPTA